MKKLDIGMLAATLCVLESCESTENTNMELISVCDQVGANVAAIYWALPEEAEIHARDEKSICEKLPPDEQKKMLDSSRDAMLIAGSRIMPK